MRRTRQGMREHEEVSALGELKNLSRVPLGLPLGETETKHRGGVTLDPGHFVFWGMGSSGNLLGEQGKGTLPAKSLGRTGKEGICLHPWPLPKDLFQLDSLARAIKPRKTVRGNIRILAFFSNICVFSPKKRGHHAKGLSICLKLRSLFSSRPDCAQGYVLRQQGE